MNNKVFIKLMLILLFFSLTFSSEAANKGHLVIVGGGEIPLSIRQEFVRLSANGFILVITSASGVPQESGPETVAELQAAGAQDIQWLHIDGPAMGNADSVVDKIISASAIFFAGGDQDRLMQRVGGTRAAAEILKLYFEKGGVIGGTSAGAAVQSRVMITGNELINKDSTNIFVSIQAQNVETKRGFGFLDNVIIDQHFAARKRHNRLISLVLEHPELVGIGIDECTAIIVNPNNKFRVHGEGTVIMYDARKAEAIRTNKTGVLAGKNMKMHVLVEGDEY